MIKTRVTLDKIKLHFTYSWWMYLLMVVVSLFAWDIAYNITKYVPPPEKTLVINFVGGYVPDELLQKYTDAAYERLPEMELIEFYSLALDPTGQGDYAGLQKLTVMMAAGEGDVYFMDEATYKQYVQMQCFAPLDEEVAPGGALHGLFTQEEIAQGTLTLEGEAQPHCYALPTTRMYRMLEEGVDNRRMMVGVTSFTENYENAVALVGWMAEQNFADPPDWLSQLEENEAKANGEAEEWTPIG